MKYIFIINYYSILEKLEFISNRINSFCTKKELDYEILNNRENDIEDILKRFKKKNYYIIVVGGDGIINRALNALVGTNNILGFIPYGTGNDFYRCAKKQCSDGVNELDLVKINKKYFINIACFGIDAEVANNVKKFRNKFIPKSQRYNLSIVDTFFKYKNRYFKVYVNNQVISNEFVSVVVCNGEYYGRGFRINPKSKLDDGLLNIYLLKGVRKSRLIKLLLKLRNGKLDEEKEVEKILSNKVILETENDVTCNIDGEEYTSKRFEIEVIPKGIKLFYNQEMIDNIIK